MGNVISRARIALINKFVVSRLMCNHRKKTIPWLMVVFLLAVSWMFIKLVCYYSSFEEHDDENSTDFKDLLLTTTGQVIRPRVIRVIDQKEQVDDQVEILRSFTYEQDFPVLGMSVEVQKISRKCKRPLVFTLQFATKDGYCVLFRVNRFGGTPSLPDSLVELLSDDNIWKVGIDLYTEANYLHNNFNNEFGIRGTFDLRYLTRDPPIQGNTLNELAATVLHVRENRHCKRSNWGDTVLPPERIFYAAMNAYLGILLFKHFFRDYIKRLNGIQDLKDEDLTRHNLDAFFEHCEQMKSQYGLENN